jgi:hypothetical protein
MSLALVTASHSPLMGYTEPALKGTQAGHSWNRPGSSAGPPGAVRPHRAPVISWVSSSSMVRSSSDTQVR